MMITVSRRSGFSGKMNKMKLPCTLTEIAEWQTGTAPIQDMLPQLNPDEREFLMTGVTPEEWDEAFGGSDES